MKISFSTLGCPDWNFNEIFSVASDLGYNGIEIRGIADEIYAPKSPVFSESNIGALKKRLSDAGIEIPILTSGAYLVNNPKPADAEFEAKDYILLASRLGVKYVRVLADAGPAPVPDKADMKSLISEFSLLCEFAANYGVTLLTETNGFLADSNAAKAFMESISAPNAGIIWDIHHTARFFDEKPADTVGNIGKYIKHTHIKDSVKGTNGKITYMLTGYGDIPVADAVKALQNIGYDGYYSYEWVKRWSHELAEPGIAFHQFINFMREL